MPETEERVKEFHQLLDAIGIEENEHQSLCHSNGSFHTEGSLLRTDVEKLIASGKFENEDVWFSPATVDGGLTKGQRPSSSTVVRVPALWADLDVKDTGLRSTEDCWAVVNKLSEVLGTKPVAVVESGSGGLHPYWKLERYEAPTGEVARIVKHWGNLVKQVAKEFGGDADSVFDLSRILRVPGTVNRKTGAVVTTKFFDGQPVSLERVQAALKEHNVPAAFHVDFTHTVTQADSWPTATHTCSYAQHMIDGWANDEPEARHPWFLTQATRLYEARRIGCVTTTDFDEAAASLSSRFRQLTLGTGREPQPNEINNVWRDARRIVESSSDDACRKSLGNHKHKSAGTGGAAALSTGWEDVDFTALISGDYSPPVTTLLPRSDGVCLLYPGESHSFLGQPESGKSLVLQWEVVRLVNAGQHVLYLDFESRFDSVFYRLVQLGVQTDKLSEYLHYQNISDKPTDEQWERIQNLPYTPTLIMLDGVNMAMSLWGYKINDANDASLWYSTVPNHLAAHTGAAVAMIDHLTKNAESTTALGSQQKTAQITGATFLVEKVEDMGFGLTGSLSLKINRDRPGTLRRYGAPTKNGKPQEIAYVTVDSCEVTPDGRGKTYIEIGLPRAARDEEANDNKNLFKHEKFAEACKAAYDNAKNSGAIGATKSQLKDGIKMNNADLTKLIDALEEHGYLTIVKDSGRYPKYRTTDKEFDKDSYAPEWVTEQVASD